MSVETAIYEINHAPLEARIQAIESLLHSIKHDISKNYQAKIQPNSQEKKYVEFPVFDMGKMNLPTREELYDEACERHFQYEQNLT